MYDCEICGIGPGCLCTVRECSAYYYPASKEQVIDRLYKGLYKNHRDNMKKYLKDTFGVTFIAYEKIAEAMKVLQEAAERAVREGFYGTIYGQPYDDGMQIIHIEPNEAQLDGQGIYYQWGGPGPDFNRYYLNDYGKTWALTEEEITGRRADNGN